ncbi:FMNH2-utilizing oxygenase [Rhodococcoides trifolii]|uniref:FMNH2-utilizing oxygenase n=1 Tax=Rhodococcoides trifolii TaxID=908250 RepID=A0A917CNR3_9NOCA|nr:LLM class flavin-dependent oxidoreductase [Rhodococcus trifolii]GGF94248.1 FMNH2-utilizing oxygenase [Rhodococcus trifolii]
MSTLAIELTGTGAHPQAWRRKDSRAEELFGGRYWVDVAQAAERAGAHLLFVPDAFDGRSLDAVAIAARVATSTSTLGLVPTVTVTHTEPFHVSKAIATVDIASLGRAGWQVEVSEGAEPAALVGRKDAQNPASLWQEAGEAAEVVTRLWDSWEDNAEIRDESTNRFVDRDKLHYIDFEGEFFSVKGPSITPRSPQGQPPIAVRVTGPESAAFAAAHADIVRIRAASLEEAAVVTARVRRAVVAQGRDPQNVRILLDIDILVGDDAAADVAQLEEWAGQVFEADTVTFVGNGEALSDLVASVDISVADGVTLRPLTLSTLLALPSGTTTAGTLRDHLGLDRPANQYAI